jgi:hypothetical protein
MPYQQHFFVEGRHLGTVERLPIAVHAEFCPPRSTAYFCPKCAEIWARCPVEGHTAGLGKWSVEWAVLSLYCRKHSDIHWHVPGSLMNSLDGVFNSVLPEAVLRWELARHFEYYDCLQRKAV